VRPRIAQKDEVDEDGLISKGGMSSLLSTRLVIVLVFCAWALALGAQAQSPIPQGPAVLVSDEWYHVASCTVAIARKAPTVALADALRAGNRPCPLCEPLHAQLEWATFVKAHGDAIREEVRLKGEADAAEAKRKADEAEAERLRKLAEFEAERKRRETAPVPRFTEAQIRDIAKVALAEAGGDATEFQARFRARVRDMSPDYAGPQIVHGSSAIRIYASGPVSSFETAVMAQIQKGQPPLSVTWMPDVTISVVPEHPDAPDIKQIVVQRTDTSRPGSGDLMATQLSSTLAPRRLPGGPPTAKPISYGDVVFPLSTFEPGAGVTVRVIAVPVSGPNLSRSFTTLPLRAIQ
jgi:hypothetical protein